MLVKINKKIEELEKVYEEKINNLNQTNAMVAKLKTECVNLEGQLKALKDLTDENTSN